MLGFRDSISISDTVLKDETFSLKLIIPKISEVIKMETLHEILFEDSKFLSSMEPNTVDFILTSLILEY